MKCKRKDKTASQDKRNCCTEPLSVTYQSSFSD